MVSSLPKQLLIHYYFFQIPAIELRVCRPYCRPSRLLPPRQQMLSDVLSGPFPKLSLALWGSFPRSRSEHQRVIRPSQSVRLCYYLLEYFFKQCPTITHALMSQEFCPRCPTPSNSFCGIGVETVISVPSFCKYRP